MSEKQLRIDFRRRRSASARAMKKASPERVLSPECAAIFQWLAPTCKADTWFEGTRSAIGRVLGLRPRQVRDAIQWLSCLGIVEAVEIENFRYRIRIAPEPEESRTCPPG